MSSHLHIVSFNVPLPANYGGVIDVFYRLKALSEAGVRIHLHAYTYGRPPVPELERYCEEVHYYDRDMSPFKLLTARPFIVSSRCHPELRKRLAADRYPILLEGLHCCSLLEDDDLCRQRTVMVRAHNVEADYYSRLAKAQRQFFRRIYLRLDAAKIRRYEPVLRRATAVLAITEADRQAFLAMGCRQVLLVSGAHPFAEVSSLPGRGAYALFHGNLSVAENYRAVDMLLQKAIPTTGEVPFVVAGNRPPQWLKTMLAGRKGVTLVENPDDETMRRLVAEAQVTTLVTEQPTGLKLKLLQSLYTGRHCLVNSPMVHGTGLESLCVVADDPEAYRRELLRLMATDFSADEVRRRAAALAPYAAAQTIQPIIQML